MSEIHFIMFLIPLVHFLISPSPELAPTGKPNGRLSAAATHQSLV